MRLNDTGPPTVGSQRTWEPVGISFSQMVYGTPIIHRSKVSQEAQAVRAAK